MLECGGFPKQDFHANRVKINLIWYQCSSHRRHFYTGSGRTHSFDFFPVFRGNQGTEFQITSMVVKNAAVLTFFNRLIELTDLDSYLVGSPHIITFK